MARLVSDEVWQGLDPNAGRLSPLTARRLRVGFAAALVLAIAGTLVWYSGFVVPRLGLGDGMGWVTRPAGTVEVSFEVVNRGLTPVTLLDAGRSGPGLELLHATAGADTLDFPVTLRPGEEVTVELTYRITDCDSVPRGDWPITAVVERPWGALTVHVEGPWLTPEDWQEQVVELWCDPQAWPID